MSHDTRSAAILAGGQATRLGGRDKSALLVDGGTMLDRQIAALSPLTDDLMIVGGRRSDVAQSFQSDVAQSLQSDVAQGFQSDVAQGFQPCDPRPALRHAQGTTSSSRGDRAAPRSIADIVPGCGPLGGLHAALTAARSDALFLVACDMPYLSTAFVAYLFSLVDGADIVVPRSERGYHPLCAVYTRACLEPAAARLANRRLKMQELVDSVRTRVVPIEDIRRFGDPDRLLANVNTPADYASLEALQGHKL